MDTFTSETKVLYSSTHTHVELIKTEDKFSIWAMFFEDEDDITSIYYGTINDFRKNLPFIIHNFESIESLTKLYVIEDNAIKKFYIELQ